MEIKNEILGLVQSVVFRSSKIDDFESDLNKTNEREKKIKPNGKLPKDIKILKSFVNHFQQRSLETQLEIQGISLKNNDDLKTPIELLMKILNYSDLFNNNAIVNYYDNPVK